EAPSDANADNVYLVEVTANDGANNTVQSLSVTVTDTNDNRSEERRGGKDSMPENTTAVVILTTSDADTVGTNPATLSITGGADAGKFTISGGDHIEFVCAPNFEAPSDANADNVYLVEVTANDGANNTVQSLSVTVTDTNDN